MSGAGPGKSNKDDELQDALSERQWRTVLELVQSAPDSVQRWAAKFHLLHVAALEGQSEIVRAVLAMGVNADLADDLGLTPLMLMGMFGKPTTVRKAETVQVLIDGGASINAEFPGTNRKTALDMTSTFENRDMTEILLQHNARANTPIGMAWAWEVQGRPRGGQKR